MSLYNTNEVIESNVPLGGQLSVLPPYLERSHIKVYEGVTLLVDGVDYEWTTTQSLTALRGLTAPIRIKRETPGDELLSGSEPMSYFDPEAMEVAMKQAFYLAQELEDDAATAVDDAETAALAAQDSATAAYASEYQAGLDAAAAAASEANALTYKNTAQSAATTATTKAGEASASAAAALASEGEAEAAEAVAITKAGEAAASAAAALASEGEAEAAEAVAITKAGEALTSAGNAATSEANALSYRNAAEGYKDYAEAAAAAAALHANHGNYIINGAFQVAQRGATSSADGYGPCDRWKSQRTGSSMTCTHGALAPPFSLGLEYYLRNEVSSVTGSANFAEILHGVENLRRLAGKTLTLSFYAKADTAGKQIAHEFVLGYGAGGSSAEYVYGSTRKWTLSTSWQRFSTTVTLGDFTGKTIGSGHALWMRLFFDAGTGFDARTDSLGHQSGTFDIANVKLEEGDTPTAFITPHLGETLQLCQRYYYKSAYVGTGEGAYHTGIAATFAAGPFILFPVVMRTTPTVTTVTAPTLGNCALGSTRVSNSYFYQLIDVQTVPALYRAYGGLYAFDAEL